MLRQKVQKLQAAQVEASVEATGALRGLLLVTPALVLILARRVAVQHW
jgi:hypothetical protein